MPSIINADNLALFRGGIWLFHELSFSLSAGDIFILNGHNGSGKTSLLRALAGFIPLDEGAIYLGGQPTPSSIHLHNHNNPIKIIWYASKDGLGDEITARQMLHIQAELYHKTNQLDEILAQDRFKIADDLDKPLRLLSSGIRQRISLSGLCLHIGADNLWLLDEPNSHLDDEARQSLDQLLADHQTAKGMAVIASHLPIAHSCRPDILRFQQVAP